jgi:hypothetical protein
MDRVWYVSPLAGFGAVYLFTCYELTGSSGIGASFSLLPDGDQSKGTGHTVDRTHSNALGQLGS